MSATLPSISVLLPVHNDSSTLARAVGSVRRQTFRDWELILLDDGSTEDTPDLIEFLAREDRRIHPVHLPHRGIAASLNAGLERASGRYIARMDAVALERAGLRVVGCVDVNPGRIGTAWKGKPVVGYNDLPAIPGA